MRKVFGILDGEAVRFRGHEDVLGDEEELQVVVEVPADAPQRRMDLRRMPRSLLSDPRAIFLNRKNSSLANIGA
jgi:hypothetical protein